MISKSTKNVELDINDQDTVKIVETDVQKEKSLPIIFTSREGNFKLCYI